MFTLGCCLACLSIRKGVRDPIAEQIVKHSAKIHNFQHVTRGRVSHE